MTEPSGAAWPAEQTAQDAAMAVLSPEMIDELREFGTERAIEVGDVLYRAGDATYDFMVILEGEVVVVRPDRAGDVPIIRQDEGRFLGELNLLTGQRVYHTARVTRPGRVLVIADDDFRRRMSTKPDVADVIFRAFLARRDALRQNEARGALKIIGSRFSAEALALRGYAARARLVHTWIDVEDAPDVDVMLADMGFRRRDIPVVVTPTAVLRHATPGGLAEYLGLTYHGTPGYMFDLVVVGSGPAGLAAAVYGASEGLQTVSLDGVASWAPSRWAWIAALPVRSRPEMPFGKPT